MTQLSFLSEGFYPENGDSKLSQNVVNFCNTEICHISEN